MKTKRTEKEFYTKIYSACWNQYIFLMAERERYERKLEAILIVAGVLSVPYISANLILQGVWNLVGFGCLVLLYIVALISIIPRQVVIPWVQKHEFEKYLKNRDSEALHKQLVEEANDWIDQINHYRKLMSPLLRTSMNLLILASAIPVINFIYNKDLFWFAVSLIITISLLSFLNLIFGKRIDWKPDFLGNKKKINKIGQAYLFAGALFGLLYAANIMREGIAAATVAATIIGIGITIIIYSKS